MARIDVSSDARTDRVDGDISRGLASSRGIVAAVAIAALDVVAVSDVARRLALSDSVGATILRFKFCARTPAKVQQTRVIEQEKRQ